LDLCAELGVRTLRYPLLWEWIAPNGLEDANWAWADERMNRLRALGIRPIVGLVHHGSGPRNTSLVDPAFATKLAEYARAVAERYPWVDAYTPVNEPLTTARFSGLYGHWYPHGRDALTFMRALLHQCRAVALAMRAIREINPTAQLIQTEDLGKTYSTPRLAYQAAFENERRWLSFDLLAGRVDRHHPLWQYLTWVGVAEADLADFLATPCPPDLLGLNIYVTSERFLDERLDAYPAGAHGGNDRDHYADLEAVRVRAEGIGGPGMLLREAWERYQLPLAITETHIGCTREEQVRWLVEVWDAAQAARAEGVDVRAVTAWSVLGTFDWHCLVTRDEGQYEPGVYDIRGPRPRPTALAWAVRDLAAGRLHNHPALDTPGWWRRPDRLLYLPYESNGHHGNGHGNGDGNGGNGHARNGHGCVTPTGRHAAEPQTPRPILITGARGTLGGAFARACVERGLAHHLLTRQEMDIADAASVEHALRHYQPWAVINAAGYLRVDDAEREPVRCYRENTIGPAILAAGCAKYGVALVAFSSDLVFDGAQNRPYVESDAVAPLNVYGRSKAEAERQVHEILPAALIIRTSAFFSPWDDYNFMTLALRALRAGQPFAAADDAVVSPTYVPDLVRVSLNLLTDGEHGIWHLANAGQTTWAELAGRAAELGGVRSDRLARRSMAELGLTARRPRYSALGSERGLLLPSLEDALHRYIAAIHTNPHPTPQT
jgi:dTDP-4-dehydrorhamnose reductase